MNDKPNDNPKPTEPLDAFDTAWTSMLAEPEQGLTESGDAFVASVMAAYDNDAAHAAADEGRPAIAGRIGLLPWAVAAAIVIAALVGWYMLGGNDDGSSSEVATADGSQTVIDSPAPETPNDDTPPTPRVDPSQLRLGELIAQTRTTVTAPAANLPAVVKNSPQALRIERLLELFDNPVPDLEKLLPPREPVPQQSRA